MYPHRVVFAEPRLPEPISRLRELARDFWFTWKAGGIQLFRGINPDLWREAGHNPVKFLVLAGEDELKAAAEDESYLSFYRSVVQQYDEYMASKTWFSQKYPQYGQHTVAYFSAEFGLHESHPIYSGGLGLLAGDYCKSASDLGLPFVAVGILYKHGYFTQRIGPDGRQEAVYPYLNFFELPVTRVAGPKGSQLLVPVEIGDRTVYVQLWKAKVGRVNLYLLDADTPANRPEDRCLTGTLYTGDLTCRLGQEILLGVGGVRALRALGINPSVWHINEGHSAFLVLERMRELVKGGFPLDAAREMVRASTVFTTHTPVPAGHDVFDMDLVAASIAPYAAEMGVDVGELLELGRDCLNIKGFNMTLLAINNSCLANGVSRLHAQVSKKLFYCHFGGLHPEEVPVVPITNGVHTETWMAFEIKELFERYLGKTWVNQLDNPKVWERVRLIPDEELWRVHTALKEKMIAFVRTSLKNQRRRNQEPAWRLAEVEEYLDTDYLTVGFARRFATYKRATLLFREKKRLSNLVNNPKRPVRFVFAGKAHPADLAGQEMVRQIYSISQEPEFLGKVILLENYDIHMARHLLQGVDLWLNTPRRPLEACGTSGQKAAVNGVVNLSTLDGWWPEAYNGKNGFSAGTETDYASEEAQDRDDCHSLFAVLEDEIIPLFYRREAGVPRGWVKLMKESICTIAPVFNTHRMLKDYTELFYLPALKRYFNFARDGAELARRVAAFKMGMKRNWPYVSFVSVETNATPEMEAGSELEVTAVVRLGPINPGEVAVELVLGEISSEGLRNIKLSPLRPKEPAGGDAYRFYGSITLPKGTLGYTVRVRPASADFPYQELPLATWAPPF